jgi:hypothetical protein
MRARGKRDLVLGKSAGYSDVAYDVFKELQDVERAVLELVDMMESAHDPACRVMVLRKSSR